MQSFGPTVLSAGEQGGVTWPGEFGELVGAIGIFPVKVGRDTVIIQGPADRDMMEDIFGRLGNVVAVFAVHSNAVAVNDLKQGDDHTADFADEGIVVIELPADTSQPFEKVAMGTGQFRSTF